MPNYTIVNGELYHVGVKGMKWGVRKKSFVGDAPKNRGVTSGPFNPGAPKNRGATTGPFNPGTPTKQNYKDAKKAYNKAYRKAHNYSGRHFISQWTSKGVKAESNKRWDDAMNKAKQLDTAQKQYKAEKKAQKALKKLEKQKYKETIKKYRKEIQAGETVAGRIYNRLTDADKYQAELMYAERHPKKKS